MRRVGELGAGVVAPDDDVLDVAHFVAGLEGKLREGSATQTKREKIYKRVSLGFIFSSLLWAKLSSSAINSTHNASSHKEVNENFLSLYRDSNLRFQAANSPRAGLTNTNRGKKY